MKLNELHESVGVGVVNDIFQRAEKIAYDEAADQNHGVSDDRLLAIAKQIIHNEIQDQAVATATVDAIADKIHSSRK